MALKSSCSIWHCKQPCIKFLFSLHPNKHLVLSVILISVILEGIMGLKFACLWGVVVLSTFSCTDGEFMYLFCRNFWSSVISFYSLFAFSLSIFWGLYCKYSIIYIKNPYPKHMSDILINSQSILHGLIFTLHLFILSTNKVFVMMTWN